MAASHGVGGANAVKRVQLNVTPPTSTSIMHPSDYGANSSGFSQPTPAAPASDRLGELLRMYSELSQERKVRAFDYITQLHRLDRPDEHPNAPVATQVITTGRAARGRRALSSPPPPPGNGPPAMGGGPPARFPGRNRPTPLQVPQLSSYENVSPPVVTQVVPQAQQAPVELRVSLTTDQLKRLSETMTSQPNDPLDGLVQTVFSPTRPGGAATAPPLGPGAGGGSPLRRQFRQPTFGQNDGVGGESIYSMLNQGGGAPGGGGGAVAVWGNGGAFEGGTGGFAPVPPPPPPPQPPPGYSGQQSGIMTSYVGGPTAGMQYGPGMATDFGGGGGGVMGGSTRGLGTRRRPVTTPPPFVHPGSSAAAAHFEQGVEEARNLHDHLDYLHDGGMDEQRGSLSPTMGAKGGVSPGAAAAYSPGGSRRPFMQSLTSMHHTPTDAEAHFAAKRREEWLRDLSEQKRANEEKRKAEEREREIEDLKEELRFREMREKANQQLSEELARSTSQKGGGGMPKRPA